MKNKFILISFVCILVLTLRKANCQEWEIIQPNFDPPGEYHLSVGDFIDGNTGWLATSDPTRIFITTDGGKNFTLQFDSVDVYILGMDFIDGKTGWVVVTDFGARNPFMLLTSDGGLTWETQDLDTTFYQIKFFDTLNGLAAAYKHIYFTEDGGINWEKSIFPDTIMFNPEKNFFLNNKLGWAVGYAGHARDLSMILKTYDSGRTWHTSLYETDILFGIAFADSLYGCAVGWGAKYTEDGGKTWKWSNNGGGRDVAFSDDSTAWSVGSGTIRKSTDRGRNWTKVEGVPDYNYRQIIFVDSGRVGYIPGGLPNALLKYEAEPVKVHGTSGIHELNFRLYQNYPNPFNPTTVIGYELRVKSDVQLTVFDLTGREIKTLVSGFQPAGFYQVPFNGAGLASGVYYYKIKAGQFVQSKKMILIH